MTTLRVGRLLAWVALTSSAGCALTLDYGPPMPDAGAVGTLDSGIVGVDVGPHDSGNLRDGRAEIDAGGVSSDASVAEDSGIVVTLDGDLALDASGMLDATLIDAGIDAALVDAGSDAMMLDANMSNDAGAPNDAAMVVCMGVHPIIGPPRTCNPGSCLCMGTDACFTATTVASCCTGPFACAPASSDCMATHPIIGPPRTCASGGCYCANPDACFPADRAARCCAVALACVP